MGMSKAEKEYRSFMIDRPTIEAMLMAQRLPKKEYYEAIAELNRQEDELREKAFGIKPKPTLKEMWDRVSEELDSEDDGDGTQ